MQRLRLKAGLNASLVGQRLGAGVDHLLAELDVLGPHRHQAPVEDLDAAALGRVDHGVDVVGRRRVVVRGQRRTRPGTRSRRRRSRPRSGPAGTTRRTGRTWRATLATGPPTSARPPSAEQVGRQHPGSGGNRRGRRRGSAPAAVTDVVPGGTSSRLAASSASTPAGRAAGRRRGRRGSRRRGAWPAARRRGRARAGRGRRPAPAARAARRGGPGAGWTARRSSPRTTSSTPWSASSTTTARL